MVTQAMRPSEVQTLRRFLEKVLAELVEEQANMTTTSETTRNLTSGGSYGVSNTTQSEGPDIDAIAAGKLAYIGLFFILYGGLIFSCLIGLGVYNKKARQPSLYQMYVERTEVKQQVKRMKKQVRGQQKKLGMTRSQYSLPQPQSDGCLQNLSDKISDHGIEIRVSPNRTVIPLCTIDQEFSQPEDEDEDVTRPTFEFQGYEEMTPDSKPEAAKSLLHPKSYLGYVQNRRLRVSASSSVSGYSSS